MYGPWTKHLFRPRPSLGSQGNCWYHSAWGETWGWVQMISATNSWFANSYSKYQATNTGNWHCSSGVAWVLCFCLLWIVNIKFSSTCNCSRHMRSSCCSSSWRACFKTLLIWATRLWRDLGQGGFGWWCAVLAAAWLGPVLFDEPS